MYFFEILTVVMVGLIFGSFATALSYRVPRKISIVTKVNSSCPFCNKNLEFFDLIPLFSWIFLRGKCRHCKEEIGIRYPLIELATLFLCLAFYSIYGINPESAVIFILAPILISIIDIDLNYKIIPDSLNFSVLLAGVLTLFINTFINANPLNFLYDNGLNAIGGFLLYGLSFLFIRQLGMLIMKREAMGMGDIKFFAVAGFWLGLNLEALALLMVISGISGVLLSLIWKKIKGESEFPFGPSIILGFISALCIYKPDFILF